MPESHRRPLSHAGGKAQLRGQLAYAEPLRRAMEAQADLSDELEIHGIHSHAGRMHPAIPRVLLQELQLGRRGTLLDPFCGVGTTIVEAAAAGWRTLGNDLDPVALAVARAKTQRRDAAGLKRLEARAQAVAEASEARVRSRVPVMASLPREELIWYDMHVLKELAGLLEEIRKLDDEADRKALEVVFSSMVVKFSRQRSDTRVQRVEKKIRKGLVTEFFGRKSRELVSGLRSLSERVQASTPTPRFVQADVRQLPHVLGGAFVCDLVLCSPPYAGTFDYLDHHARRRAWLGLNARALRKGEMGARRHLSTQATGATPASAVQRWREQVGGMLDAITELLREEGMAVFIVGDGAVQGQVIDAAAELEQLSRSRSLEFLASASQARPEFGDAHLEAGAPGRREHAVLLVKNTVG